MLQHINIDFIEAARLIGSGCATVGVVGAGVGIGIIFGCFLVACARNPNVQASLFGYTLLGFALCEAIALFALMMGFLILFL